jgi:hypothetical protein
MPPTGSKDCAAIFRADTVSNFAFLQNEWPEIFAAAQRLQASLAIQTRVLLLSEGFKPNLQKSRLNDFT